METERLCDQSFGEFEYGCMNPATIEITWRGFTYDRCDLHGFEGKGATYKPLDVARSDDHGGA